MIRPASGIVTSPTGAGAGVLTWDKTNWLVTTYPATAPVIPANPKPDGGAGQHVTFTVAAGGSAPLCYQWYFNTNTPIANATNATLTLTNVQLSDAGVYFAMVTNTAGAAMSSNAVLKLSGTYAQPQVTGAGFTNGLISFTIAGDSGPDYIVQASTNLVNWEDIFTNYAPTPPFNWRDSNSVNFLRRFYRSRLDNNLPVPLGAVPENRAFASPKSHLRPSLAR